MNKEHKNKKVSFLKMWWVELVILIALLVGAIHYSMGTLLFVLGSLLFGFYFGALFVARGIVMFLDLEMQKLQRSRKDKKYYYKNVTIYSANTTIFLITKVYNISIKENK